MTSSLVATAAAGIARQIGEDHVPAAKIAARKLAGNERVSEDQTTG